MKGSWKLTEQTKLEIIEKYLTGKYTYRVLAKEYLVDRSVISRLMSSRKIPLQDISHCHKKYSINEHYFDIIDCERKAYWLGWLYADGYNNEKNSTISIGLQEEDKHILEEFKKDLEINRPLYFLELNKKNPKLKNQYSLVMTSKHMSSQLALLGCFQAKSLILEFPTEEQVPFYLINHFIRGYWDGNGTVGMYKGVYNYQTRCSVVGTENFLKVFANKILDKYNFRYRIYKRKLKYIVSTRYLTLANKEANYNFLIWLYKDHSVYLIRKYIAYQKIIQTYDDEKSLNKLKSRESVCYERS
jgi:hypothetical protein